MVDFAAVRAELDPQFVELTQRYLEVVDAGDLDALEAFYAPDFVNIRYDRAGQVVNIPRAVFMGMLRGWAAAGPSDVPVPLEAQSTQIIATSRYSECVSVLMVRVKGGETVAYNFVWQQHGDDWLVVREFTLHDALPGPPSRSGG